MIYIILSLLLFQPPEPRLDGDEVIRVLEGLHAPIRDFEFVCEGETRWLADTDMFKEVPDRQAGRFQGAYAYRQDGAAYWDLYLKPFDPRADFQHDTFSYSKGRRSRVFRSPDRRSRGEPVRVDVGSPDDLGAPISPQIFIYLGYWRRLGYSTKDISIDSSNWDEVDGNRVLQLTINEFPQMIPKGPSAAKVWSKYWVDLRRGGHVLKHERYRGSNLISRTHRIRLVSIPLTGGGEVWLPIHGEFETFWWLKGYSDTPIFREVYDVVRGSIVLNSGLPDERFSIGWKGRGAETEGFKQARRDFEATPPKPVPPPLRTDPAGVEEYQRQRLAEAERQAKQLDASPPARRGWDGGILIQGILATLGAGTLIAALLLRRRAS